MKKFFLLFLLTNLNFATKPNLFLQASQILSPDNLAQIELQAKQQDLFFTWYLSNFHAISYFTQNQQPGFVCWLAGVPIYSYNFISLHNLKKAGVILKNNFTNLFTNSPSSEHAYHFTEPLKFSDPRPVKIALDDLCNILKDKTFIFYTGAGLSAASGVPTMSTLEKTLKIDLGIKTWFKAALNNPQELADSFGEFTNAALSGQPTPGHYAITQIAQDKKIAILTENIDLLQHKTGIAPEFIRSDKIYLAPQQDYLAIDYLICVGLSHDDCGFIAHYKAHNPAGRIIALDLNTPNYLSETDYLLQADLQTVLPSLAINISK